ncbi:uncharacterized protein LOC135349389 [Halichondria panicea]|uniref:uncharacterized protein LOC135349389 n=1 Tax=Halichondria panicea TaxID=6063 RepID=UPI00312B8B03
MDPNSKEKKLVFATQQLTAKLTTVVTSCAKEIEEDGALQFSKNSGRRDKGIMKATLPIMLAYCDWLMAVGVKTRQQMKDIWEKFVDNKDVRDCVEELKQAEEAFNSLLEGVNEVVQKDEEITLKSLETVTRGGVLPTTLPLQDLDTGAQIITGDILRDPYTLFILNRNLS